MKLEFANPLRYRSELLFGQDTHFEAIGKPKPLAFNISVSNRCIGRTCIEIVFKTLEDKSHCHGGPVGLLRSVRVSFLPLWRHE